MKIITSFIKKLFILIISSLIAASVWIGVETSVQPADNTRIIALQKTIYGINQQILVLENDILNRPEKGLKKYLHKTKNFLTKNQIKDLRIRQIVLTGHLKEMQLKNNLGWEKFIKNWKLYIVEYALYVFILLALLPLVVSLLVYFVIAYFVEKSPPITALKKAPETVNIDLKKSKAALTTELFANQHLYLRGGWKGASCGMNARTKFMWKWSAPLVTFAADLFELIDFSPEEEKGEIIITSPLPDFYIGEITLNDNSAIVIRPRFLVGVTDNIKIKTVWSLKLHNIFSGKIRQIILYGSGRVYIYGSQGIEENDARKSDYKIEASRLIGYDAHSAYSLCRTETWWHYFRKEASLFDIKICKGIFLTQTVSHSYEKTDQNVIEKCVNFILNGIGSFLGL